MLCNSFNIYAFHEFSCVDFLNLLHALTVNRRLEKKSYFCDLHGFLLLLSKVSNILSNFDTLFFDNNVKYLIPVFSGLQQIVLLGFS